MKGEEMSVRKKWKIMSRLWLFAATIGLFALCSANVFGAIIIVPDQNATIQGAIDLSVAGDTVMVRDGTYKLTDALDFKGKAITVKSENGVTNCILDGQGNTRLVYFHSYEGNNSILSGFMIQNGKADSGGGIYCDTSSPTITKCIIRGNYATSAQGGGIYCKTSSPIISNCAIVSNNASNQYNAYGGGIYCSASSPEIIDCDIIGNRADGYGGCSPSGAYSGYGYGGGIYFDGGSPTLKNSTVTSNTSNGSGCYSPASYGGGIFSHSSSPNIEGCTISNNSCTNSSNTFGGGLYLTQSFPSIVNTIISGNAATRGAGIYFNSSSSTITNCTIVRNTASGNGGSFYCTKSSPAIVNSILWQNGPEEIFKADSNSVPIVTYSDVFGGYDGNGNINTDPLFVNIAGQNFHLQSSSPCVDHANNSAAELPDLDRDGNPRIWNAIVDMGAYEYFDDPILSVSPLNQNVAKDAGKTSFSVLNTGTGTMPWTAAVSSGGSWLKITSGASGNNAGTFACSYDANTSKSARTGTIRVTAVGASGSPKDVTVTQTGVPAASKLLSAWSDGVFIWNQATTKWTKIPSTSGALMIAAGKVDTDNDDDLIGVWSSGLWIRYSTTGQWSKLSSNLPTWITAGDLNNDGRDDLIGSWKNDGVYYRDSATGKWIKITTPARQLATGKVGGSGRDDLIGVWDSGLWARYSATAAWQRIDSTIPIWITAGDMTGNGRSDIIGSYASGTWYRNSATGAWIKITTPTSQLVSDDIDGDGRDDLIGIWPSGVWALYGATGQWQQITSSKPYWITTGRISDAVQSAGFLVDPLESVMDTVDLSPEAPGGVRSGGVSLGD
jgi:hypothetical protein